MQDPTIYPTAGTYLACFALVFLPIIAYTIAVILADNPMVRHRREFIKRHKMVGKPLDKIQEDDSSL